MCNIIDNAREQARILKELAEDLETFTDMMRDVDELELYFNPQTIKDMGEDNNNE